MKVTTLIENTRVAGMDRLVAEHGLSLHIEHGDRRILFDTGASGAFADNAARLGVDLAAVDVAVLSHHHCDHGGGLRRFLEVNRHATVYLGESPAGRCCFKALWIDRYVGLDAALLQHHGHRFRVVNGRTAPWPGATILTEIRHAHPLPPGNRSLYVERDGQWLADDFRHELVLVLREHDGLVAFTGCSHQGILNMVETVAGAFPDEPLKAVFGGFHLVLLPPLGFMAGSRKAVRDIGARLLQYPLRRVYTGHCTGSRAYRVLKGVMGDRLDQIATGRAVTV